MKTPQELALEYPPLQAETANIIQLDARKPLIEEIARCAGIADAVDSALSVTPTDAVPSIRLAKIVVGITDAMRRTKQANEDLKRQNHELRERLRIVTGGRA